MALTARRGNHNDCPSTTSIRRERESGGPGSRRSSVCEGCVWPGKGTALTADRIDHNNGSGRVLARRRKSQSGWLDSIRTVACNSRVRATEGMARPCRQTDDDDSSSRIQPRRHSGDRSRVGSGIARDGSVGTGKKWFGITDSKHVRNLDPQGESSHLPSRESGRSARKGERGDQSSRGTCDWDRGTSNCKHRVGSEHGAYGDRLEPNDDFRLYVYDRQPVRAIIEVLSQSL